LVKSEKYLRIISTAQISVMQNEVSFQKARAMRYSPSTGEL
jgi:hypothetical protein